MYILILVLIILQCTSQEHLPSEIVPRSVSLSIKQYASSNHTQWRTKHEYNNAKNVTFQCNIDILSLCLIQSDSTFIVAHDGKLFDFWNVTQWTYSNEISLLSQDAFLPHRRLWGRKRRKRRRARRKARRRRRAKRRAQRRARRRNRHRGPRGPQGPRGPRGRKGQIGIRGPKGNRGRRGWPGRRGRSNIRLFKGLFRGIRSAIRGRRCGRHSCRPQQGMCMNTMCGAMGMGMNPMMMAGMGGMMGGMGAMMNPMLNPMMGGMGSMGMMSPLSMIGGHGMHHTHGLGMGLFGQNGVSNVEPEIVITDSTTKNKAHHRRMIEMDDVGMFMLERCRQIERDWLCLIYDWYHEQMLVKYIQLNGATDDVNEIFEIGMFETNQWKVDEINLMNEQIFECQDDLMSFVQNEEFKEICVEKWKINENDLRILIKHKQSMALDIELNLMDKGNWNEIFYVNHNRKMLCRYLFGREVKSGKVCVDVVFDSIADEITKIKSISISQRV